ncbi:hypothetical protein EQG49_06060 [Periweissella cryptocerci]|uniref:Uncharacterized protein n=1 Tax=Periweissella cryptocerci TaxID=2506420 RepID=A0A4P6YTN5_9LACO|nr:hypothetical protein [Periweissella cryptocerci]QBO36052.1 hypothetical protein EQG49_06060 [Periweissella cryptocerci]
MRIIFEKKKIVFSVLGVAVVLFLGWYRIFGITVVAPYQIEHIVKKNEMKHVQSTAIMAELRNELVKKNHVGDLSDLQGGPLMIDGQTYRWGDYYTVKVGTKFFGVFIFENTRGFNYILPKYTVTHITKVLDGE